MIGGVNFQPGSLQQEQQRRQEQTGSAQGVQEAIKVLSLRLPKTVGAQATVAPQLLNSQGSGGRPHVDSIVESVLAKYFPGAGEAQASAPMIPSDAPSQAPVESPQVPSANAGQPEAPRQQPQTPAPQPPPNFWTNLPRIIIGLPPGDQQFGTDGRPLGGQPQVPGGPGNGIGGVFEQAPDLRGKLDWLPQPSNSGGYEPPPMV